jgi:hypothetical protein
MTKQSLTSAASPISHRPQGRSSIAGRYDDPAVLARLANLQAMAIRDLKAEWRSLFGTEPPPNNRKYLESRLAYRIQELAFGGLKAETVKRLAALAHGLGDGKNASQRSSNDRPIAGTTLLREWQGVEHCVTVGVDRYEYQGRPYQSLSAIARSITGTRWNGWLFFGLRKPQGRRT